jgi:transposase
MKTSTTIHTQATREWRRRRAWELRQQGWTIDRIGEALGVHRSAVCAWLKAAREGGPEALASKPVPGRPKKLTDEQRQALLRVLAHGAEAYQFRGDVWTTKRVATVIEREFGVRYHPAHVSKLLRALGWTVQKPIRRASQRDERAIAT